MSTTSVPKGNSIEIDVVRAALYEDYEVLDELGRGGMAVVYRARERALDREVAIKVLPAILAMDSDFVQRFTHEARTAGKLEHPNIVPIYRVGSVGSVIYFVMKLLSGQSLSRVLRDRGRLSVAEVRRILIETASALGYAARRGVVHRDIKPDNLLLDSEGRCVITDFGIAKAPGGAITAAGTSLGTPRYMSPEHAQGVPLDGRSDMYSLGIVAYQCLTGRLPYDADDPFAILYKHINEALPRPELESEEEWALYAIIERMLAKKAEDRFQSADDLIVALGGTVTSPTLVSGPLPSMLVAAQPTEIIPTPTFGTRMKRFWTQDWRSWAGATAIAVGAMFVFMITRGSDGQVVGPAAVAEVSMKAAPAGGSTGKAPAVTGTVAGAASGSRAVVPTGTTNAPATSASKTASKTVSRGTRTAGTTPPSPAARRTTSRAGASRCPQRPQEFTIMLDTVAKQRAGATLPVYYDVCGLPAGTKFVADIRFRKPGGVFRGESVTISRSFPDESEGLRERRRQNIDIAALSPGRYRLDLIVTREGGREPLGKTVEFQIER